MNLHEYIAKLKRELVSAWADRHIAVIWAEQLEAKVKKLEKELEKQKR